jgi:hypothetical protein
MDEHGFTQWWVATTPSPPSNGGEGRGEEAFHLQTKQPLSSILSPLLRRGARKKMLKVFV